jgi:DNA-binding transcriptional regulator YiaG
MRPPPVFSARKIRSLRRALQLNQEDFAHRLGLAGKSIISLWESSKRRPNGPVRILLLQLWQEAANQGLVNGRS